MTKRERDIANPRCDCRNDESHHSTMSGAATHYGLRPPITRDATPGGNRTDPTQTGFLAVRLQVGTSADANDQRAIPLDMAAG